MDTPVLADQQKAYIHPSSRTFHGLGIHGFIPTWLCLSVEVPATILTNSYWTAQLAGAVEYTDCISAEW